MSAGPIICLCSRAAAGAGGEGGGMGKGDTLYWVSARQLAGHGPRRAASNTIMTCTDYDVFTYDDDVTSSTWYSTRVRARGIYNT